MEDRDGGVYSPPPDDRYDDRGGRGRGALLLGVSVVVLAAAGAMAWSTYNLGVRDGGRDAPPRIIAEPGPFRTEPSDPGGVQTPNQEIEVYDTLSGERRETVEQPAPPPETPMEEALDAPEEPADAAPADDGERRVQIVEADPAELRPSREEEPPEAAAPPEPEPEPEPAPVEPEPEPEPEPAPAASVNVVSGGSWLVQLAALRSEAEASATWNRLARAHPGLIGQANMDVQRADLGDRGIYFRLRAGSFSSRGAADSFCSQLKSAGQDCLVVSR